MNELERFWIWAIDEKPTTERFLELCGKRLNPLQRDDLRDAAELMAFRLDASSDYVDDEVRACFEHNPIAFRDLSLALHAALSRMREQVPDRVGEDRGAPPVGWRKLSEEVHIGVDMTPGVSTMMGGNGAGTTGLVVPEQALAGKPGMTADELREKALDLLSVGAISPETYRQVIPEAGNNHDPDHRHAALWLENIYGDAERKEIAKAQRLHNEMAAQPGRLLVAGTPFRRECLGEWLMADEDGVLRDQALGIDAQKREREEKRDRIIGMFETLHLDVPIVERKTPEQLCEMYPERTDPDTEEPAKPWWGTDRNLSNICGWLDRARSTEPDPDRVDIEDPDPQVR